jgi:hypothetical protein
MTIGNLGHVQSTRTTLDFSDPSLRGVSRTECFRTPNV